MKRLTTLISSKIFKIKIKKSKAVPLMRMEKVFKLRCILCALLGCLVNCCWSSFRMPKLNYKAIFVLGSWGKKVEVHILV